MQHRTARPSRPKHLRGLVCLVPNLKIEGGGGAGYSSVACLSHMTIAHASLSKRGTVPTLDRDTSNVWALLPSAYGTPPKLCRATWGTAPCYLSVCLSHMTVDHASLSRRGIVPTPNRYTANVGALLHCASGTPPKVCRSTWGTAPRSTQRSKGGGKIRLGKTPKSKHIECCTKTSKAQSTKHEAQNKRLHKPIWLYVRT